ncbi:uncharacterized protein B0H18DRAFT_962734 [Fomitopsis serialis]|uniref:uncharacterized protein n=1 Tax=Fomitopsis serialis TaxID=139415 RepID=UPI002007A275|nr:uncharacterized protein B0H18DRAFT_962734 [Neoantrodia serialis]KAH9910872.1 hypothetical protein B0H18DRAFT_962734 [Neoantrodia serialis]
MRSPSLPRSSPPSRVAATSTGERALPVVNAALRRSVDGPPSDSPANPWSAGRAVSPDKVTGISYANMVKNGRPAAPASPAPSEPAPSRTPSPELTPRERIQDGIDGGGSDPLQPSDSEADETPERGEGQGPARRRRRSLTPDDLPDLLEVPDSDDEDENVPPPPPRRVVSDARKRRRTTADFSDDEPEPVTARVQNAPHSSAFITDEELADVIMGEADGGHAFVAGADPVEAMNQASRLRTISLHVTYPRTPFPSPSPSFQPEPQEHRTGSVLRDVGGSNAASRGSSAQTWASSPIPIRRTPTPPPPYGRQPSLQPAAPPVLAPIHQFPDFQRAAARAPRPPAGLPPPIPPPPHAPHHPPPYRLAPPNALTRPPTGGWRRVEGGDIFWRIRGMDSDQVEAWMQDIPEVGAADPGVWDRLLAIKAALRRYFAMNDVTVTAALPGPGPQRPNSEPFFHIIRGITQAQANDLAQCRWLSAPEITLGFEPWRFDAPFFLGAWRHIERFGDTSEDGMASSVRDAFEDDEIANAIRGLIAEDIAAVGGLWTGFDVDDVFDILLDSIMVRSLPWRRNPRTAEPLALIYCQSPTADATAWLHFRNIVQHLRFGSAQTGAPEFTTSRLWCTICHSTDHPTGPVSKAESCRSQADKASPRAEAITAVVIVAGAGKDAPVAAPGAAVVDEAAADRTSCTMPSIAALHPYPSLCTYSLPRYLV